ncbi:hypothetical protein BC826DRAFT_1178910 [Russula brevipes]|nr:hypothetical protein BC826DRAFT_1178910 [Russula brevipes]
MSRGPSRRPRHRAVHGGVVHGGCRALPRRPERCAARARSRRGIEGGRPVAEEGRHMTYNNPGEGISMARGGSVWASQGTGQGWPAATQRACPSWPRGSRVFEPIHKNPDTLSESWPTRVACGSSVDEGARTFVTSRMRALPRTARRSCDSRRGLGFQLFESIYREVVEYGNEVVTTIWAEKCRRARAETESMTRQRVCSQLHTPSAKWDPTSKDGPATQGSSVPKSNPKSNWALPLEEGPLLAVVGTCGITFTFGGLAIDPDTFSVLRDESGNPIPRFHCTGEVVGDGPRVRERRHGVNAATRREGQCTTINTNLMVRDKISYDSSAPGDDPLPRKRIPHPGCKALHSIAETTTEARMPRLASNKHITEEAFLEHTALQLRPHRRLLPPKSVLSRLGLSVPTRRVHGRWSFRIVLSIAQFGNRQQYPKAQSGSPQVPGVVEIRGVALLGGGSCNRRPIQKNKGP